MLQRMLPDARNRAAIGEHFLLSVKTWGIFDLTRRRFAAA